MFLVFVGPPGAGKGTQSKRLLAHLKIPHLSTGEMLRKAQAEDSELGKLAAQYMDTGRLVPDDMVMTMVLKRLDQPEFARGCLFDGIPRTLEQARALDRALAARETPLDAVIALEADAKELIGRMLKRAAAENRGDDHPQVISERMEVYRGQTAPLLDYYRQAGTLRSVDALGTPEEVFERIKEALLLPTVNRQF